MNKKFYITYADEKFKKQKDFALKMAKSRGNFDEIIGYSRSDIDTEFYKQNKHILEQKRGGGYWLWKPYFIVKTLDQMNDGDYLFYSDAGAFFLQSVDVLINELEKHNQNIMGFELPLMESQWTKKELFLAMECNAKEYSETNQIMASYILIQKTPFSVDFFNKYLKYGCNDINITDKYDNKIIQDENFIDHRHDQSVFSLLYKKYCLKPFKDPSQFGKYPKGYSGQEGLENLMEGHSYLLNNGRIFKFHFYNEKYENILYHNRSNNAMYSFLKYKIKVFLSICNFYKGLR